MVEVLKRYKKIFLLVVVLSLLLWGGAVVCQVDLAILVSGIPKGIDLLRQMFPPEWSAFPELIRPALETVQIAFVGTVFGAALSFIISLFAAHNVTPNRVLREIARGILSVERALPDLIIALFFVAIVGLGPFPGVMALTVSSIGMLGKLFADAIEEIDPKPLEALVAVGATKLQVIRYAVLPQVLPSLIANSLYRFDVNIRMSVFIGVVGAGGIGFELLLAMQLLEFQKAFSAIIIIFVLVLLCEKLSNALRKRIIGEEVLR